MPTLLAMFTGGNLVGQNLTPTRVTFVGSGKEIDDDAEFTYNDTTNTLSVGNITATGNVNAAFFNGNGSGLTGTVGGSRYYGQFWDTTTQNNGGATTANPMTFNTSDAFNTGVSITVGNTSHRGQLPIQVCITYSFQHSLPKQILEQDTVSVWLAKDGVNVADSCTDLDLNNNNARSCGSLELVGQSHCGQHLLSNLLEQCRHQHVNFCRRHTN
jgi:hypothetical protein